MDLASAEDLAQTDPVAPAPVRVLLVEDDPDAAQLVGIYLARDGKDTFDLEWVSNLSNAIERLSRPGIDVLLLDLGVDDLQGYKSHLAVTRTCGNGVPVVIFTADESMGSRVSTQALGAAAYLVKDKTPPAQLRYALRKAASASAPLVD